MNVLRTTLLLSVVSSGTALAQSDSTAIRGADATREGGDLREVVVVAPVVAQSPNGTTYRLTPQMKARVSHSLDALNLLPSVSYSELDKSIKVGMESNVLLLINGGRYPMSYFYAMPLEVIQTIEVQHIPEPKYAAEGYKAVINIKTTRSSLGHDLYLSNYSMIAPTGNNGGRTIANEQPSGQYRLTTKRADLFVGYGYGDIHWNYPIAKSVSRGGQTFISSPVSAKEPNDHHRSHANNLLAGVNYYVSDGHMLSLQYNFLDERASQETNMSMHTPGGRLPIRRG